MPEHYGVVSDFTLRRERQIVAWKEHCDTVDHNREDNRHTSFDATLNFKLIVCVSLMGRKQCTWEHTDNE